MTAAPRPPVPDGPYLVAGLGVAGSAAAAALAGRGAVTVWAPDADPDARAAAERLGATVRLGPWPADDLAGASWRCLVKSPGVPLTAPIVAAARRRAAAVIDEAELGWRLGRWPLVGVTGTNGKGTVCRLVAAGLRDAGVDATCGGNMDGAPPLSAIDRATELVVGELSSYQLEACPALRPQVAALTNLTRDHLDRHGTMARYAAVKRRLFLRDGEPPPPAAIGVDEAPGSALAETVTTAGGRVVRCGRAAGADVRLVDRGPGWVRLRTPTGTHRVPTALPGEHNARNLATAVATAVALGLDPARFAAACEPVTAAPGRFEAVVDGPFLAVVDFAHNPAAVAAVLDLGRERVAPGASLRVLLGATGGVDAGKRAPMGRAAAERADHVVLTTGSRYDEAPASILAGLADGAQCAGGRARVELEPDRRAAIGRLVAAAGPGDVLLLLGRGPQTALRTTRATAGRPFDDRVVLREALSA